MHVHTKTHTEREKDKKIEILHYFHLRSHLVHLSIL